MEKKQEDLKKVVQCEVLSNKRIAPDHYVMELDAPWLGKNSMPGQFVSVSVKKSGTDPLLRVPLGIHKINPKGISLLYKVVGRSTELLSLMRKADEASVLGPLGNGFDISGVRKGDTALIVSGGHGVAPLYVLSEVLMKKGADVGFFTGACRAEHIVCEKDLKKLGAKMRISTDDGSRGKKCYVTDLLGEFLERKKDNEKRTTIFACGPRPMLAAVSRVAAKHGVAAQVSVDAYMACGIGACLGCAIMTADGYKMVCKDGPVFDSREIVWEDSC